MLPLTRTRKSRISNRLAGFTALLLVVTSLAGVGGSTQPKGNEPVVHTASQTTEEATAFLHSGNTAKAKSNKGFKMSLFLFRNY